MKKRKGRGASVWIRLVALLCVQVVLLTMTGSSSAAVLSVQSFVAVASTALSHGSPSAGQLVAHLESWRTAGSGRRRGFESPPEPAEPAIWRGPPGRRPHAVEGCLQRAPRRSRTGEGRHPLLSSSTGSFESGRQFTWDDLDQLSKEIDSSTTNTFVYNASGERTHKRRSSLETVYVNPYYTIRSGLFQTKHIYAGATRVASSTVSLSKAQPPTPGSTAPLFFYYHTDHLGSTGYTTGASGNLLQHDEYFPGGEVWFEEVANGNTAQNRMAYLFNAKELDETGLYYYGARYYNPRSGVWVSPDPVLDQYVRGGPNGGVFTPGNLGLYTYTWNNPVALRDPDGRFIDTIADVGFTLFDVGKLLYDEARGETGNRAVNVAAIGLDAAAILVPFVTGAGLAARLGAHAVEGVRVAEEAGHAAEAVRVAEHVGEAGKVAEQAAELSHVAESAGAAERGGAAAAKAEPRFISQPDGTLVDTHATPRGSYKQPNGGRTDILQGEDHGAGLSHTHDPKVNVNPKTGQSFVNGLQKPGRPVSATDVENIRSGKAPPADPKGR